MNSEYVQLGPDVFAHPEYAEALKQIHLDTLDAIFAFEGGKALVKKELTHWRSRTEFVIGNPPQRCFLKRYDHPPMMTQVRNWLAHGQKALTAMYDYLPCGPLEQAGVGTYHTIAYGGRWRGLFEDRSFVILLEIPAAQSLEKQLPDCLTQPPQNSNQTERAAFIYSLADFVRRFHQAGYCHRDLYLCHIFFSAANGFSLIDLQRAFQPRLFRRRWILKDLTQLYYSSPGDVISQSDRLRFYLRYCQKERLTASDRRFIRQLKRKAWWMADRQIRRGKEVPFAK
ncbi:MAG: lipopolysaccharide kinase InaA family protein [Anaerohalosphaeraceae bacterium]